MAPAKERETALQSCAPGPENSLRPRRPALRYHLTNGKFLKGKTAIFFRCNNKKAAVIQNDHFLWR